MKTNRWGNDAWVNHICQKEMPALSCTVRLLENLANDDTISLARLGQSVLHDYALTASILKVANSAAYMGRNQVTTVSRAAVVLGISTMKNICITAKLIDSMLKNKNLTESVCERLLTLMAQSFHAGMITEMLMPKESEAVREETFIIALLHHIGECAFWSTGGPATEQLDKLLKTIDPLDQKAIDKAVTSVIGTTFSKISIGLAANWNLGDVFIRSLDNPDLRSPQLYIASLAGRLSACIANPEHSGKTFAELLQSLTTLTGHDETQLREQLSNYMDKTEQLLESYNAKILIRYLYPNGAILAQSPPEEPPPRISDEALQLKILRELTFLTTEKGDFNVVIQTAVEGIYRGIGMDRVIVLLKNNAKQLLEPRFVSGEHSEQLKAQFVIPINAMENVFIHLLKHPHAAWIKGFDDERWQKYLSKPVRNITSDHGFFLSPVMWDTHCIGLFYADRQLKPQHQSGKSYPEKSQPEKSDRQPLNDNDFLSFTHFVQQTNLCLSIILKQNQNK